VANLAQRGFNRFHFDQEIADFFKEIVEVIRPDHIRESVDFEVADVLACAHFGNQKENADAAAILGGDGGEFAQGDESRALDTRQSDIGDDEGPFPGLELSEEHLGIGDEADTPAFGIQDLFDRAGTWGIAVKDEKAHLAGLNSRTSTHNTDYSLKIPVLASNQGAAAYRVTGRQQGLVVCVVSGITGQG
jgi:hypothetical protein